MVTENITFTFAVTPIILPLLGTDVFGIASYALSTALAIIISIVIFVVTSF